MDKKTLIKNIVGLAASSGASIIVSNIVKQTTPLDSSGLNKILISVGTIGLSGMISAKVAEHTDTQVDYVYEMVNKFKGNRDGIVIVEE